VHIYAHEHGDPDKPALVLLHPGPGLDGSVFTPAFLALTDSYHLIAPDIPGNGRSDALDEMTFPAIADALSAWLAARDIRSCSVLGHSFGAKVALQFALDNPRQVAALVVSCGMSHDAVPASPAATEMEQRFREQHPDLYRQLIDATEREAHVTTADECWQVWREQLPYFVANSDGDTPARIAAAWQHTVTFVPAASRGLDLPAFDVRARLAELTMPVLAITGEHDRLSPPQEAAAIAQAVRCGQARAVAGAGHFPFLEQPDEYLYMLQAWLREHAAQRSITAPETT
jgi:pimeloyl-ACP methyl ester carboxylesterase